jgi:oligopeptide/dipeptide ABC transporter ATP-binding protein
MSTDATEAAGDRPGDDLIVEGRDITVSFDMERGASRVVDGVDLDLHRNEILGVVGESGSGKSMLASALLNAVVEPGVTQGRITFDPDGEAINVLELEGTPLRNFRWDRVAMVFQGAMDSFNPTMKVREHFLETLRAHNHEVLSGMDRAEELISDLYMEPERVLDAYPHELSGGMLQRTLIALSMLLDPDVLVLDEPTAALDLLMQRSILELLGNIRDEYGVTMLFITHDLPLVSKLADRLAVMYSFQIVERGPTQTVLREASHPYTRALLKATPNIDGDIDDMRAIEGSSPDPVNVPSGCSYHPRCPLARDRCEREEPALRETTAEDHTAACFYWEEAAEELPFEGIDEGENA